MDFGRAGMAALPRTRDIPAAFPAMPTAQERPMSPSPLALVEAESTALPRGIPGAAEVRVVIADGQALVRAGFRALLEGRDGISIVGEAADGDAVLALAARVEPDVLLVDFDLPGTPAIDVTQMLLADPALAGMRVLIVAAAETDERVFKAVRAGASGFLLKDRAHADLVEALRSVADGEAALSPSVARRVMAEIASLPESVLPTPKDLDELTPREREVVALVAGGLNNDEIAERLVVTPATSKTHVSRAMRKLAVRDRAQLVTTAYETGLVVPGPQRRTRTGAPICAIA
jgi:DNA-binding NarL/FixJ family response regulator